MKKPPFKSAQDEAEAIARLIEGDLTKKLKTNQPSRIAVFKADACAAQAKLRIKTITNHVN